MVKQTVVQKTFKARILNNQFESVFTNEDLSNISIITSDATPQMPSVSFSAHGILENLVQWRI